MLISPRFASGSHPPQIWHRGRPAEVRNYVPPPDKINVLQTAETCCNWIVPTHKPISISTSSRAEAGASRADKFMSGCTELASAGGPCALGVTHKGVHNTERLFATLSLCIRSQTLTYLLEFCNVPRLDQSEKSICLLISFPLYHLRYNSNTQKEMVLEISGIQSLHPFKSSRGQRPSGEMPNRGI